MRPSASIGLAVSLAPPALADNGTNTAPGHRRVGNEHHEASRAIPGGRGCQRQHPRCQHQGCEASAQYIERSCGRRPAQSARPSPTTSTTPSRPRWSALTNPEATPITPRTDSWTWSTRVPATSGPADRRRRQPGRRPVLHERLRGSRLRRVHRRQHRLDPARHLQLPNRGGQRRRGRGSGRRHLQPGQCRPGDERFALFGGTLDAPQAAIPVVSTSFATGAELAGLNDVSMHLS